MKIFFLSDVHGALERLERCLEAFERERARHLVFLGDALYHGPRNPVPPDYDPAGTARLLNGYARSIVAVRGNCDSEVDQMMLDYPMSQAHAMLLVEGRRFFLTHGHLHHPGSPPPLAPEDILVFGHTHVPLARQEEAFHVFNPGSPTFPKESHPPTYGVYEDGRMRIKKLDGETIREHAL